MPRPSKGPRLWLAPAERDQAGRITAPAHWCIRDGRLKHRTGCGYDDRAEAERQLADYIAAKHNPAAPRRRDPASVTISDVLNLWLTDVAAKRPRPQEAAARVGRLVEFFGDMRVGDITGPVCRAYAAERPDVAGRRELEDLRAAINHAVAEQVLLQAVPVVLPDKRPPRERWLTPHEAALLLRAAWQMRQRYRGEVTDRRTGRHIARFIMVALYTGTRAGAICAAAIRPEIGRGYVDLDRGVFYRRAPGSRETKKRQPPAPLPDPLLAHIRRWARKGFCNRCVVEWNGKPVARIHKGFRAARVAAGLGSDVTPHVLRHTAVTWAMQRGADLWAAAGYFGMSVETLERVYGHHHPSHVESAREAMSKRPGSRPGQKPDSYVATERERTAVNKAITR